MLLTGSVEVELRLSYCRYCAITTGRGFIWMWVCFGVETGYLTPEAKKLGAEIMHCPKSPKFACVFEEIS